MLDMAAASPMAETMETLDGLSSSPEDRPSSPSLSTSPSLALDAVPHLDRSVSAPSSSSVSSLSVRSKPARLSEGATTVVKRRGYMRPQGTAFADSARNRDSVMSLGSIAHMQYYFARTGLLDGKGAQLAKEREQKKKPTMGKENAEPSGAELDDWGIYSLSLGEYNPVYAFSESGQERSVMDSPTEYTENGDFWNTPFDPPMLPPTVSTYKQKPSHTEPLPDMPVLRRELKEALQDACKVLEETQKHSGGDEQSADESNGFYEIQGLHLLDIMTLAIRAAKNYYTAHTNPQRLYNINPEKAIRSDLYKVLDVLKRMASRNFRGGMRMSELTDIILWIESIDQLIKKEEAQEQQETAERESWIWREGDWSGRERQRECLFLKSFDVVEPPLPQWENLPDDPTVPTDFLRVLQDGVRLVKLHNALVNRSKRNFGEIKTWHEDVGKPYRMAENLRFWVKASELRWEIKLDVTALDVVNGKDWRRFDEAVLRWCQGVRGELTEEWRLESLMERRKPPELKVEVPDGQQSVTASGLNGDGEESVIPLDVPVDEVAAVEVPVEEVRAGAAEEVVASELPVGGAQEASATEVVSSEMPERTTQEATTNEAFSSDLPVGAAQEPAAGDDLSSKEPVGKSLNEVIASGLPIGEHTHDVVALELPVGEHTDELVASEPPVGESTNEVVASKPPTGQTA